MAVDASRILARMDLVVTAVVGWLGLSVVLAAVLGGLFHSGHLGEGAEQR